MSEIIRNSRRVASRPVLIGAAAVTVLGSVLWVRHNRAANADTGVTDGSTDTGVDGYDTSGYGDYSAPDYGPYGVTPGIEPSQPTPPANNPAWTRAAADYLAGQGFNPANAAIALGVYLAGGGLTDSQYNIVTAAIAGVGYPPTRPAPPHKLPAHGQTPLKGAPHLTIASQDKHNVTLRWTTVKGSTHYRVQQGNGRVVKDVVGTRAVVGKHDKQDATVHVTAYRLTRAISQPSNTVTVHNS